MSYELIGLAVVAVCLVLLLVSAIESAGRNVMLEVRESNTRLDEIISRLETLERDASSIEANTQQTAQSVHRGPALWEV